MQIPTEPIWVDQPETLKQLCEQWRKQSAVAVDTEFMRSDTFYPIAGLIQVGDGKGCYLIDPLAFDDLTPLAELMTDTSVTKVLHSCSEDLELFKCLLNVVPTPLFDTQVAAAFAGFGFSIGYAGLARDMLNLDIPKGETRSDWLRRPLSVSQLKYAALDVAHLLIIYGKLLQKLKADDRLDWVRSDCATLVAAAKLEPDFNQYYQKVNSAWKLNAVELETLKQLCEWREHQARLRDIPRNRVVKEPYLLEIAKVAPETIAQLTEIEGIHRRTLDEDGEALLSIVKTSQEVATEQLPELLPPPLGREERNLLKALKVVSNNKAEALALPPEALARKKDYESIVRSCMQGECLLPPRLNQWRFDVIGCELLQKANSLLSEST